MVGGSPFGAPSTRYRTGLRLEKLCVHRLTGAVATTFVRHGFLPLFRRELVGARRGGRVLTDDRAPVEWLTDRMLLEQIARGTGLDEAALPTEP